MTSVDCPHNASRKSFTAYYRTEEPPPGWTGESHSTVFNAQRNEVVRCRLLMPFERMRRRAMNARRRLKISLKRLVRCGNSKKETILFGNRPQAPSPR